MSVIRRPGITVKQVVRWLLIGFFIWWVVTQPGNAEHMVGNIGSLLHRAVNGLGHLITSI